MSFFELACKNIRGRFVNYFMYFMSVSLSVMVFVIFALIFCNPQFASFQIGTNKISLVFRAAAIAVLLFSVVFVLYSNRFFLRTRKKEIAIYSLLGMQHEDISKLLFYENFVIGALALICGTLLGTLLSRFFTNLLLSIMAVNATGITFTVSISAIVATVAAFILIFAANSVYSSQVIYQYKLIDLLSAEITGELYSSFSPAGALLSGLLLLTGYVLSMLVDVKTSGMRLARDGGFVILLILAGTLLLFHNLVPMLARALQNNRRIYFQPANFISISQITHRAQGNSKMLSMVSIVLSIAMTMTCTAYSLYKGLESTVLSYSPYSYICRDISDAQFSEVQSAIHARGEVNLISVDRIQLLMGKAQCGAYMRNQAKDAALDFDVYLLSADEYQKIIESTSTKRGRLSNTKTEFGGSVKPGTCFFIDSQTSGAFCKSLTGQSVTFRLGSGSESLTIDGVSLHKYIGLFNLQQFVTLVVDNDTYNRYAALASPKDVVNFTGLMFDHPLSSAETVKALDEIAPPAHSYLRDLNGNISYIGFYQTMFALYGTYVFIGAFVGVLFLLALGSILYYKQLAEAQQERSHYAILRKIGMRKREARSSVRRQLGIVFGLPFVVGTLHMLFALFTYQRATSEMGADSSVFLDAFSVWGVLSLLYFAFYLFSASRYFRTVWKNP
ncbi:MAG: ABC transporter permease [Christensenella sp.]|nr:ABC transporter permease [Christensenella sp.]